MLNDFQKLHSNLQSTDSEILDLKRQINDFSQKLDIIIKELKMTAGQEELNTLKKYLDLWNPSRFATREEVEKIIKEKLQKNL